MKQQRQSKLEEFLIKLEKQRLTKNNKDGLNKGDSQQNIKNQKTTKNLIITKKNNFSSQKNKKIDHPNDTQKEKDKNMNKQVNKDTKADQNKVEIQISGSQSSSAQISQTLLSKQRTQQNKMTQTNLNVKFYMNKIESQPSGDFIDTIHKKWWGNYNLLEAHHGYIQWIFPNSFQSRFNSLAKSLTQQQALQFRNNEQIAKRYLNSYMMMLEFYGIKLMNKQTGELKRSRHPKNLSPIANHKQPISYGSTRKAFYEQRFYKTFLTSFHNHMRITRILSSLVMCGFGRYAKQFSLFLNAQINGQNGGLKQLKKYGVYERQWKQYSTFIEKVEENNILLKKQKK